MSRVIVVGGGVAGLAAARELARRHEVTLLEGSDRVGGKLRLGTVAGLRVDVGAEAMLNRRPEGVELATAVGLPVVHPDVVASQIWSRGALRPLPRSLMGIPLDVDDLRASGVLSPDGLERALAEPSVAPTTLDGDVTVGDLVDARLGSEVTDRLVEPLLGGVYAGWARELSAAAAVPQVLDWAARGSFLEQASAIPKTYDKPVFASIRGGMGRLGPAVVEHSSFEAVTSTVVTALERSATGWRVRTGPATDTSAAASSWLEADAVVLAVPPQAAARLVESAVPAAAAHLADIESASVAVVTFAFDARSVPDHDAISGFLVPPVERRRIKASTFSYSKWGWVREAGRGGGPDGADLLVLRTSLGRHREEATLQASDADLVQVSREELAAAAGIEASPVDVHVQRWGGSLPQYAVGHLDRVAGIREAVAGVDGLAVCGAAYDGVGIPAVIGSALRAAAEIDESTMAP